jgi:hypothetical protein
VDWFFKLVFPLSAGLAVGILWLNATLWLIKAQLQAQTDAANLVAGFRGAKRRSTGLIATEFIVRRWRDWLFVRACKGHPDLRVAVNGRRVTVALRTEKPPEGFAV